MVKIETDRMTGNDPYPMRGFGAMYVALPLIATLVLTAIYGVLESSGIANSDDILRMVTVQDLLGGQSWFDPVQYRLGLEAGTHMHWSRLVDAPIALIYQTALWLSGSDMMSQAIVKVVWPSITLLFALLGLTAAALRLGRNDMIGPVTLIGAIAFYSIGIFSRGSLDHHNVQVALSVWLVAMLIPSKTETKAHAIAGVFAILMLAIGMETLPYVTVAGLWVAGRFFIGSLGADAARAFGLALAMCAAALLILTVSADAYLAAYCDAYSIFHVAMAGIGGLGLALTASVSSTFSSKTIGLVLTAAAALAALVVLFPQCLANPLASLDPKLKTFWLDGVIETRSIFDLWSDDPFGLFGMYGMAAFGLIVSVYKLAKPETRTFFAMSAILLVMAIAVTAWQQRGMTFAAAFAILPLTLVFADLRKIYAEINATGSLLKMAGFGVLSLNLFWWIAGANAAKIFSDQPTLMEQAASVSARDYCFTQDVFETLAKEPKGVVLGATDIGAMVLQHTHHRALAGPYHRNTAGNLTMIGAMLAAPEAAKTIVKKTGVTLIADCIRSADATDFKRAEPNGLQAKLHNGDMPEWLKVVPETVDQPLVLYRVVP